MKETRELLKPICPNCRGNKTVSGFIESSCVTCEGLGWIEPEKGNETICPECNGDGIAFYRTNSLCKACEGKGYLLKIVEKIECRESCFDCDGNGHDIVPEDCEKCSGSGINFDQSKINHVFEKCHACDGKGEKKVRKVCSTCKGKGYFIADKCTVISQVKKS